MELSYAGIPISSVVWVPDAESMNQTRRRSSHRGDELPEPGSQQRRRLALASIS
jgi:hypothetical protein